MFHFLVRLRAQNNGLNEQITSSQLARAEELKRYFDGSRFSRDGEPTKELAKFEAKIQVSTGLYYVSVEAGKSWALEGGYFAIGRKGKIQIMMVYDLSDKDHARKHYAKMFRAKG